jgi:hypothetical protein
LASNESQGETQVLGSLVGLRYRDARKTYLRWLLFSGTVAALALIGGPVVWQQIPDGWRELIWQKITLSEASQDEQSYTPIVEETSNSPTETNQPEPIPLSSPEIEQQSVSGPPEPSTSEPSTSEPSTSEPSTSPPPTSEPLPQDLLLENET